MVQVAHQAAGRLRFMVALAAPLPGITYAETRWSTLAYVEKVRPQFLSLRHLARGCLLSGASCWQFSPVAVAISNLSSGLPIGGTALFFSEGPVSLRTSGLHRFGTVLEFERFELLKSFGGKRFGRFSRIARASDFHDRIPIFRGSNPPPSPRRMETERVHEIPGTIPIYQATCPMGLASSVRSGGPPFHRQQQKDWDPRRSSVTIELNRRFVQCQDDERSDPDLVAHFGRTTGTLGWEDLIKKRRVVVLAEAGSGKTTEMEARAIALAAAGQTSFHATVEDVGRRGLEAALRPVDRARLAAWRRSEQDGWFFIDSVDEAKSSGIKLRSALQAIAEAIAGAERRAHVVLSGRYTDWEFRRDLAHLNQELGIPLDQELPTPPTPDELVLSTIHREKPDEEKPIEEPVVIVMTGLDESRVRRFAAGQNVQNLDAFMAQIDAANLWQFARRPLDLDWLVQFWHSHGRLGTLAEMLDVCIAERLQESNLDRGRQDGLDVARATQAVERIGAALVFGRKDTIAVPDSEIDLAAEPSSLDIADVLPDWSPQDRAALLTRAVFDPATFGRARGHNDNQGVVRGYLAARWLRRLRKANLSQAGLFDLLFAETYGVKVIKPSMQETAAWLSLWDESVAREITRRNPFLLLTAGDPATLSPQARENLLAEVTARIAACERIPVLDIDSLRRYSRPDLADAIRTLWDKSASHPEVQRFLLRLIWLGEIKDVGPSPWRTRVRFRLSDGRVSKAFGMRLLNCSSCSISAPTVRK